MGTKTVRLDEDVYELIASRKRDDETFSEAVERLVEPPSLLELAGILDDDQADDVRDALERSDEAGLEEQRETIERMTDG